MAKSKEEIIKNIANHFKGISYKKCYISITSDVDRRLFEEHNVPVNMDTGYFELLLHT